FSKQTKWIGTGEHVVTRTTGYESPAVQFRKTFKISNGEQKGAVCRICGLGCYVLYINGKKVSDDVLSPAFTAYDKRALFVEYDVESYLCEGENVIAVKVGNGFYNQMTEDTWGFYQASWRDCVRLLLEVETKKGVVCHTDKTWKVTPHGATVHNAIRTGEFYDARREDGWKEVGYDDSAWFNAVMVAPPGGKLCKSDIPPMRECAYYAAEKVWKSEKGWVFDFGKNISGYIAMEMAGKAGETAVFRYAETLKGQEIDQEHICCYVWGKREFSTDKYTFSGKGVEKWNPEFVYHGFRYVEVSGIEKEPPKSSLKACFVHTDLSAKGAFACDDELMSWIYEAGIRAFLSNWHGISEDCPHREKNGWTGDAVISCDYAVALFDMKEAYKKWLYDMSDAQRENGQLAAIVPTSGWGFNWGSGPAWDCALFFLPYALYKETGDSECLLLVYDWAKKYLEYAKYYQEDGLVCFGLSDWCPPEDMDDLKIMSNRLSDSCYYYKMQKVMEEICLLRGDKAEASEYANGAENTRRAILNEYIHGDRVDNDGQGALAEVLYFDIVEGEQARAIAKRLAETVRSDGYVFKVGILGMKALLNALSKYGYTEEAYKIVNRYDYPSYGYLKERGATTLWESWNGKGSLNHHMYADVVHWLFRNIGGLKNTGVAYDTCLLQPYFYAENCSA
ncbi:MAG: family 78 glycoside hydrolase catalytic domain, partial [Clostridia bacterium]|nr:family 78 glycoside hydrolase catalytic domain [Clostridia bacterium]